MSDAALAEAAEKAALFARLSPRTKSGSFASFEARGMSSDFGRRNQ